MTQNNGTGIDAIFECFHLRGDDAYFGEAVTQTAHGLQAAYLARQEGAQDALVVAALLHDIGHLMPDQTEGLADAGTDGRHEDGGEAFLSQWFGPEVTEPVRLHVAAKRYLCATDPAYYDSLSPASKQSLALQGGPMSPDEVFAFASNPYYGDAVRLRRWDDQAKGADLIVPDLETYRSLLAAVMRQPS